MPDPREREGHQRAAAPRLGGEIVGRCVGGERRAPLVL
jgi:hypothetical protein